MFRLKLRAVLVALTAIAALALPASALATNVTTWQLVQQNDPGASATDIAPYANVPTELVSPAGVDTTDNGEDNLGAGTQSLVYGHQTFGVDLTYTNIPNYQWEFIKQPGTYATQQIAAGQRVALYNTVNHQYLADACPGGTGCIGRPTEAYGINLYYSTTPQYEWQVFKGGNPATPSYADLYDAIEGGYLVPHADFGIAADLGEVQLGWIHAPFETGPDYIPPQLPVTTSQQAVSGLSLAAK